MITNDYRHSAIHYALRDVAGTDSIAFHAIAERCVSAKLSGIALDYGCGSGRSTRFLKALGFDAVGADISEAMLGQARRLDPEGRYHRCSVKSPLPCESGSFDVVLSTWVVLEQGTREYLTSYLSEFARVLRDNGKGFIVVNSPEFYSHRWVTCEVDFPENKAPLRSGQPVKVRLLPEGVVVTDTFWNDNDYREVFASSGLRIADICRPLAIHRSGSWFDEVKVAPFMIYEVERTR